MIFYINKRRLLGSLLIASTTSSVSYMPASFVYAKESQVVPPVFGRSIIIEQSPVIAGSGVVTTPITIDGWPDTIDYDGDRLVGWKYVWLLDEQQQGSEILIDVNDNIAPFIPPVGADGKIVKLKLIAIADGTTSYPSTTIESAPRLSNGVQLLSPQLAFTSSVYNISTEENKELIYDIKDVLTTNYPMNNPGLELEWNMTGPDLTHFQRDASNNAKIIFYAQDFESAADQNRDNIYELWLTLRDPVRGLLTSTKIYITVTNISDSPPAVLNANLTGGTQVGQTLTLTFQYSDPDDDLAGTHQYRWYRADDASGQLNRTLISGASGSTYTLQGADQGKYIAYELTPIAATGSPTIGNTVHGVTSSAITGHAPVATLRAISGTTNVNSILGGGFTYSDADNDPPGAHQYRWYRADNSAGTLNRVLISSSTGPNHTVTGADMGKYLVFEVVPVSTTGVPNTGVAASVVTTTPVSVMVGGIRYRYSISPNNWSGANSYCVGQGGRLATTAEAQTLYSAYPNGTASSLGLSTSALYWTSNLVSTGTHQAFVFSNATVYDRQDFGFGPALCVF